MFLIKLTEEMMDSDDDDSNVTVRSQVSSTNSSPTVVKRVKLSHRIEELKEMIQVLETALSEQSVGSDTKMSINISVQPKKRGKRGKRGRKFKPTLFDDHLKEAVKMHGYNWPAVASELGRPVSTVRIRWPRLYLHINQHKDELKFNHAEYGKKGALVVTWSDEMELKLKDAVVAFGKNWTNVSKYCGFGFDEEHYQLRWESMQHCKP